MASIRGKIAFHFPNAGTDANKDTVKIVFSNGTSYGQDIIGKVYYLTANEISTMINLADDTARLNYLTDGTHTVWEITNDVLVAGSSNVAIEFVPTADITLGSISIFATGNNPSQTSIKVYVIHESGLCVSKGTGDTVTQMTLYELSGYKHTINLLNNSKLFAGEKYYIVYQSNNETDFYPAYFQNSTGNYKDSVTVSQYSDPDISKYYQIETGTTPTFYGILETSQVIFSMQSGKWFAWGDGYGAGLSKYRMYRRTNVGSQYQFEGVIGIPNNNTSFGATQAQDLLNKSDAGDFIWYCITGGNPGMGLTYGDIYTKYTTTGTIYSNSNTIVVDVSTESTDRVTEMADILYGLSQKSNVLTGGGAYYHQRVGGYIITLKSTYTNKITTSTPLTSLPSNPQNNEIYYLSNSISSINTTGAYVYTGSWTLININNWDTYFNITDLGSVLTRVGSNSDFLEEIRISGNTVDVDNNLQNCFDTTVSTNRKYYLEINGVEV